MNSKRKYIGINQRIPFDVLDSAIYFYLEDGVVDKKHVLQSMQEFTSGTNRANKAAEYVVQIVSRQSHLLDQFKKSTTNTSYSSLRSDDRKALCLCLISLSYPIAYDLLVSLSQGFKVQSQINKKFINEKVMSIYGSNRTVEIAIDALLPMIIELNTIKRDKLSIYSRASKLVIKNEFIAELIIFSDVKLSGSKSILIDELSHKPWYAYFDDILGFPSQNFNYLLKRKESSVGKGILIFKG
jgi:hypothetical protein